MIVGHYDAPAYVRRARNVHGALEELIARCHRQRDEWLMMVRIRLGTLRALAGDWNELASFVQEGEVAVLEALHVELAPQLRAPVERTSSPRALRSALSELCDSLEHFNRRWQAFLDRQDLTKVNELRADYNRYYVLEKECAVRSPRLARQGFRVLPPLSMGDLAEMLPALPVPVLIK